VPDAAERLVNLALYLAASPRHITAEQCRAADLGYPEGQDDMAFIRMFERDKDALRAAGLVIDVSARGETEAYRLDADATYARPLDLQPEEVSAISAVAAALADDPEFPFSGDLALAVAKLGTPGHDGNAATARMSEEGADERSMHARALAEAVHMRKSVTFDYTNSSRATRRRIVDPYGVFFREGRWYLTGRDRDIDAIRTFAIARLHDLDVNPQKPRTPDFERPTSFDVRDHERLPFQYGATSSPARVRFEPDVAWRAIRLARGRGTITTLPDGSTVWTVNAANLPRLASWLVDEGPGIHAVEPPELVAALASGLKAVVSAHG